MADLRVLAGALAICAVIASFAAAHSEPAIQLDSNEIQYSTDTKEDASGLVCEMSLAVFSTKRPETLNFRFLKYLSTTKTPAGLWGAVGYGYTLDVGDIAYVNGLPKAVRKKKISDAVFTSKSFSSSGRLFPKSLPDGGLAAYTSDKPTAEALFDGFFHGKFELSFRENGVDGFRTYIVNKPIAEAELKKFDTCKLRITKFFSPQ